MAFTTEIPAYATGIVSSPTQIAFTILSGLSPVSVTIQPDGRSGSINETKSNMLARFNLNRDITWSGSGHARQVAGIIRNVRWTLALRTVFHQAASGPSEYGRGTTSGDRSSGNTSLGFHESQHGKEILDYFKTNPVPVLGISIGDSESEAHRYYRSFLSTARTYFRAVHQVSLDLVDCVGDLPMDARGHVARICR